MDHQTAINITAYAERDKAINVDSKVRACTRKASFKSSVDARTNRMINDIHKSRQPKPEPKQTVGSRGPKQPIRVWRKK